MMCDSFALAFGQAIRDSPSIGRHPRTQICPPRQLEALDHLLVPSVVRPPRIKAPSGDEVVPASSRCAPPAAAGGAGDPPG